VSVGKLAFHLSKCPYLGVNDDGAVLSRSPIAQIGGRGANGRASTLAGK